VSNNRLFDSFDDEQACGGSTQDNLTPEQWAKKFLAPHKRNKPTRDGLPRRKPPQPTCLPYSVQKTFAVCDRCGDHKGWYKPKQLAAPCRVTADLEFDRDPRGHKRISLIECGGRLVPTGQQQLSFNFDNEVDNEEGSNNGQQD
jgi:hypothetical protein